MNNFKNKVSSFLEKVWFIIVVIGVLWLWSQDFKYNYIIKETPQDRVDRVNEKIEATDKFLKNLVNDSGFKCPKEYKTKEEYIDALGWWVNQELIKNPDISKNEIIEKREAYFNIRNCEVYNW